MFSGQRLERVAGACQEDWLLQRLQVSRERDGSRENGVKVGQLVPGGEHWVWESGGAGDDSSWQNLKQVYYVYVSITYSCDEVSCVYSHFQV